MDAVLLRDIDDASLPCGIGGRDGSARVDHLEDRRVKRNLQLLEHVCGVLAVVG